MLRSVITFFCLIVFSTGASAWNASGHRLIARIAYHHLSAHAMARFEHYNHALDKIYRPVSWNDAAVWLDTLRYRDIRWFDTMHYVDIPFTQDNTPLPTLEKINAIWSIEKARSTLVSRYTQAFDKGLALRVLLHTVGDLHQPLHVATRVSLSYPDGDRGGNLFTLGKNNVAKSLHAYWDRGGGLLVSIPRYDEAIDKVARHIEAEWPCRAHEMTYHPNQWAEESHDLAISKAYQLNPNQIPNKAYQQMTQQITEQRIAQAGCRLAALLTQIDNTLSSPAYRRAYHRDV